jgi:DNA-binding transcriptional ArsR family regulator
MAAEEQTANNLQHENNVSRLSKMQKEILLCLGPFKAPDTEYIGDLPRTGEIIEALGRPRTASNYSVVSRALSRLEERGLTSRLARPRQATRPSTGAHRGNAASPPDGGLP